MKLVSEFDSMGRRATELFGGESGIKSQSEVSTRCAEEQVEP